MATQTLGHYVTEFLSGIHVPEYAHPAPAETNHSLAPHELLALPDENLSVLCVIGELWLTRLGDIEDYILGPGQSFSVRRGDKAAVQALKSSRVRLLAS